jgi:cephalosporin hydroxylase
MNLYADFKTHIGRPVHKWLHYFPVYERHFASWRNRTLTVWEIGVFRGGSLELWSNYFGPMTTVVGIDIDPACAAITGPNIHIRIGSQSDTEFLSQLIDEFGAPDIVIDDGSHQSADIRAAFQFLYPRLSKNGIYVIEDQHTAYWDEFGDTNNSFITSAKRMIDQLNADHSRGQFEPNFITRHTLGISFYDSLVVVERGNIPTKTPFATGTAS